MTPMMELINSSEQFAKTIDRTLENMERYSIDIAIEIEKIKWAMHKTINNLREIRETFGD